jgi:hypothetical protein
MLSIRGRSGSFVYRLRFARPATFHSARFPGNGIHLTGI